MIYADIRKMMVILSTERGATVSQDERVWIYQVCIKEEQLL